MPEMINLPVESADGSGYILLFISLLVLTLNSVCTEFSILERCENIGCEAIQRTYFFCNSSPQNTWATSKQKKARGHCNFLVILGFWLEYLHRLPSSFKVSEHKLLLYAF
eukprot:c4909_g1_i1 orf=2-328(-)